jgi:hypothetical protein
MSILAWLLSDSSAGSPPPKTRRSAPPAQAAFMLDWDTYKLAGHPAGNRSVAALQRGLVHADNKNGVGEIDIPAFGLGPPLHREGERDLRTR